MRVLEKRLANKDSRLGVGRTENGEYAVFINLGEEPLGVGA